ncbi:MAG: RHS repeat protein, partial [bacterium]|nr:RHS repeat protein [bacterium]
MAPTVSTHHYTIPVSSPHANAGFGWRILPGKIYPDPDGPRTAYISSDGGEHGLYSELHPGYPAAGAQPNTTFTSDATYLRTRYFASGAGVCTAATGGSSDCYQVEFPDGAVHEMHDFSTDPNQTLWLVTRMTDRFAHGHFVAIDYATANEWRISDSHGRNHAWEWERLEFVSQDPGLNGPEHARTSYAVSKTEIFTTFGQRALTLPAEPQSQMEHTYASGALESSRYVEPCDGSLILQVADHDIDNHTGRVKTSRDSAGVATTFRHDALGRLVRTEPAAGAWTITTYNLPGPSSSDPPELTVEQCPNGSTSCAALAYQQS